MDAQVSYNTLSRKYDFDITRCKNCNTAPYSTNKLGQTSYSTSVSITLFLFNTASMCLARNELTVF